jgi:hypothetical protein
MNCPCPEYKGPPNISNLRLASIITIISTIPFFILLRVPLEYKLKSLKFEVIKKKYGESEDYYKVMRKLQSDYKNKNAIKDPIFR